MHTVCVWVPIEDRKEHWVLGADITGGCKLPDVDAQ